MQLQSRNFYFLKEHDESLEKLGALAELYFVNDPNTSLIKLRQFAEMLAKFIAAKIGLEDVYRENQVDLLNRLKHKGVLSDTALDIFHSIRKAGNKASHGTFNDHATILELLRMAQKVAVMFHKAMTKQDKFDPGPFVPPSDPFSENVDLKSEIQKLRDIANKHLGEKEKLRIQLEEERLKVDSINEFQNEWDKAGTELDNKQSEIDSKIKTIQKAASKESSAERKKLEELFFKSSNLDLNEDETRRMIIDGKLQLRGWEADTKNIRFSKGTLPEKGRNLAIAEWPTKNGPADYALFIGEKLVGVVEAKKWKTDVAKDLMQAERYSSGIKDEDKEYIINEWDSYRVPLAFSTNGRGYLEQVKTKSGIWFRDLRLKSNLARPLTEWPTPREIEDILKYDEEKANFDLKNENIDILPLRRYQKQMIDVVEEAILKGERKALVAMATGTGKTRTAICLAYRLIKTKKFNRILFLVDRTSLGDQAKDSFEELKIDGGRTFAEIYNIEGLDKIEPELETKVHFATVQSLVKRILYPSDLEDIPSIRQYDCIIVDECHRGYTLDKELSEHEFTYRSEQDFISKYRRVIDHFDAVKIGLTATPAKHTNDIFGKPLKFYTYSEAVVDGFLVDHEPPIVIKTKLSEEGIKWEKGDDVQVYDPEDGNIDVINMEDEVKIEVENFNKQVITENFNKVVVQELIKHLEPLERMKGKTLVYCARDDHADMVVNLLKTELEKEYGEGSIPNDLIVKITATADRPKQLIKKFKNETYPNIVVTVDLLTTGIDVPEITNLVFLRRIRSRILFEQMLGRATRLCEDIDKDSFKIYDAVGVYNSLKNFTSMKPVVKNPKVSFEELAGALDDVEQDGAKNEIVEQILAKFQAKKKHLKGEDLETFKALTKMSPSEYVDHLKEKKGRVLFDEDLARFLDRLRAEITPVLISTHNDEVTEVSIGLPDGKEVKDYLSEFKSYIVQHEEDLPALKIVLTAPRDLKRDDLKKLQATLMAAGFGERTLDAVHKELSGEEMAASIIGHIRKAMDKDILIPFNERLHEALDKLKKKHDFKKGQLIWLERIAKQIEAEKVVDHDSLNSGIFRTEIGGFEGLNKIFEGNLDAVLGELHGYIWQRKSK